MPNDLNTNISNEEYSRIDALNYSSFKHFLVSPQHYKDYLNTPQEETAAMRLGTAIHSAVLTPSDFADAYTYAPEVDRRTREGRLIWDEFVASNPNKVVLKKDEFDICIESSRSAHSNAFFKKHWSSKKCVVENAIIGEMFGVKVKGRIDLYDEETNTVIDLKSISVTPTLDACRTAMYTNMYHIQAFFYSYLIKQKYGRTPDFVFGFLEKKSPFSLGFVKPNNYTLNVAGNICEKEFSRYANCKLLDLWPSFSHAEVPATVSIWQDRETTDTLPQHLID
jgi:exodeoxyribonuclease VIII